MRKLLTILFAVLLLPALFTGCSDDDSAVDSSSVSSGSSNSSQNSSSGSSSSATNVPGKILTFGFRAEDNSVLTNDYSADIDNQPSGEMYDRRTIYLQLPFGTDVSSLVPYFTTTDGVTNVQTAVNQVISGTTVLDFTWEIVFFVDNPFGTAEYAVKVEPEGGSAASGISRFKLPYIGAGVINTNTDPVEIIFSNVAYEMDVSSLEPTITLENNQATIVPSPSAAYDFTTNNFFTVTAENGVNTTDYVVKLYKAPASSEKEITRFWVNGIKTGFPIIDSASNTIYMELYNGYSVSNLAPDIDVSDHATISPQSGTVQNFGTPVVYTVTAQDGTTKQWTVTVVEAESSDKDLVSFSFLKADNPSLPVDVVLGYDYYNKRFTNLCWPNGISMDGLVATFSNTGVAMTVSGVTQQSGVTANDYSGDDLINVVHAADGTTKQYGVYLSSAYAMDMVTFGFYATNNAVLSEDFACNINGTDITVTLPLGTDPSSLTPVFTHTGTGVKVSGTVQNSGSDSQDFSSPVVYTVHAGNIAYTRDYTVTVDIVKSAENRVTNVAIDGNFYSVNVDDTTNGINVVVPDGSDFSDCSVTLYTTTVAADFPVAINSYLMSSAGNGVYTTMNNLSLNNPVPVSVRADNGAVRTYTLWVHESVLPRAFTSFTVASSNGTVNSSARTVEVTVSNGTPLSSLTPQFAVTAGITNVTVNGVAQTSGTTSVDFTSPVTYKLWANDGSSVEWQVTVTEAGSVVSWPDGLYIWEYSQASGSEFVELWNNTAGSITLGMDFGNKSINYFLLFINGADHTVYGATPLIGGIDSGNVKYFGAASGAAHPLDVTLQSGPDAVLLVEAASGVDSDVQASWIGVDVGTGSTFTHGGETYTKIHALPYGTSGGSNPDQTLLDYCLGYTNFAVTPGTGSLQLNGGSDQQWTTNSSPTPGFK